MTPFGRIPGLRASIATQRRIHIAHATTSRRPGPGSIDLPALRSTPATKPRLRSAVTGSWTAAGRRAPIDAVRDIVTGEPAWFDTRVALLWDDDCLFLGSPLRDRCMGHSARAIRKSTTERSGNFIALPTYYEYEISARTSLRSVLDLEGRAWRRAGSMAVRNSTRKARERWFSPELGHVHAAR